MTKRFIVTLAAILAATEASTGETGGLSTAMIQRNITHLMNNILGASRLQEYFDEHVEYKPSGERNEGILLQLTEHLSHKLTETVEAVRRIQNKMQSEFHHFTRRIGHFPSCCDVSTSEHDLRFPSEQVDLNKLCHMRDSGQWYMTPAVLEVMQDNLHRMPNLKWQYFGGEDGVLSVYPANSNGCNDDYDPRFRSWYSHVVFPTPKDLVIVLDVSGSMEKTHKNRPLINIAREAATTVLDTLGPDDRVGVVYFSDKAATPSGSCHGARLALGTEENKEILKNFLNSAYAEGGTNYGEGFREAFSLLLNTPDKPKFDSRNRQKIILFLTDGRPTDSNYDDIIDEKNAKLNNSVHIMTFGLGSEITSEHQVILREIASKDEYFIHIENPEELRFEMARYYNYFKGTEEDTEVTIAVPYVDAMGLGMITSVCLPVHIGNTFRGVVGVDVMLSDIFGEAIYFSKSGMSYAIVMDSQTRLLIHPLLPRPSQVYDPPVVLRLKDIETEREWEDEVLAPIRRGHLGEPRAEFRTRRVLARGDIEHDGVDSTHVDSVIIWRMLNPCNLTVVLVLDTKDRHMGVVLTKPAETFLYHRLDLTKPPNSCRYFNKRAVTNATTVQLAPQMFKSPDQYLETKESLQDVEQFNRYFTGNDNHTEWFKGEAKAAVSASQWFDEAVSKEEKAWQSAVWRYFGTREGVFRILPGHQMDKHYMNSARPWYKRAIAMKDKMVFSKPYFDASGSGILIALGKAILINGRNSDESEIPAGIIGMDFSLALFENLLRENIPSCQQDGHRCFVFDRAGYIIAHPDFGGTRPEDFEMVKNVHITQKEQHVARVLVQNGVLSKDSCINYDNKQVQTFWRVHVTKNNFVDPDGQFEMVAIEGTDAFVVQVTGTIENDGCTCNAANGDAIPKCSERNSSCECPCYNRIDQKYDQCSATFHLDRELGLYPPCTPPAIDIHQADIRTQEHDEITMLDSCYDLDAVCPDIDTKTKCTSIAGCTWYDSIDKCQVWNGEDDDSSNVNMDDEDGDRIKPLVLWVSLTVMVVVVAGVIVLTVLLYGRCKTNKANETSSTVMLQVPTSNETLSQGTPVYDEIVDSNSTVPKRPDVRSSSLPQATVSAHGTDNAIAFRRLSAENKYYHQSSSLPQVMRTRGSAGVNIQGFGNIGEFHRQQSADADYLTTHNSYNGTVQFGRGPMEVFI